jgi:tyrosyl-tRNA synthetase
MGPAEAKMSKSIASSAIFIHDTKEQIESKINGAFCQPKDVEGNPILEIWKYIILRKFKSRAIKRKGKPNLEVQKYEELEKTFREGDLHPADLKKETAEAIDEILNPVRNYFEKNKKAKELYELVKSSVVTR